MTPIIQVRNISKYYPKNVTNAKTFHEELTLSYQKIKARLAGTQAPVGKELFKALNDVSFDIFPGEVVGIVGSNGAGKSTLLKILSRITMPTKGTISMHGRVASLLEVGTGFHPELTGRENVFMNGAILGMKRSEIKAKFDEIVAFAEVADFIDVPVKRYSSGMYVRLAFAVAAHLEPEILIVDEVLAVGDTAFQKKCMGKLQATTQQEGRTILFVSHNQAAIKKLCSRAILLNHGKLVAVGLTDAILEQYNRSLKPVEIQESQPSSVTQIIRVGLEQTPIDIKQETRIHISWQVLSEMDSLALGVGIDDLDGNRIFETRTDLQTQVGVKSAICCLPPNTLTQRTYNVSVGLFKTKPTFTLIDLKENITTITGINSDGRPLTGIVQIPCTWIL